MRGISTKVKSDITRRMHTDGCHVEYVIRQSRKIELKDVYYVVTKRRNLNGTVTYDVWYYHSKETVLINPVVKDTTLSVALDFIGKRIDY